MDGIIIPNIKRKVKFKFSTSSSQPPKKPPLKITPQSDLEVKIP